MTTAIEMSPTRGIVMVRTLCFLAILMISATALFSADIEGEVRVLPGAAFAFNARVQLLSSRFVIDERVTGTDGRFKFRNISAGSYVIVVRFEGYADEEVSIIVERRSPREFVPVALQPTKAAPEGIGETISVASLQIPKSAKSE